MRCAVVRWGHGLLAMSLCVLAASPLSAAPAVDLQATLGLGGWVVPGRFIPLRLDVRASRVVDGTITVVVPGRGEGVTYEYALRLPPGARAQIGLEVIVQDPRRPIAVEVREGRALLIRAEVPVGVGRAAEGIVAALTREGAGLEFLASGPSRLAAAYLAEPALPSRWQAYAGVDLLAIRDLDARALLPSQQQALVEWVAQGGRVLVTPPASLIVPPWLHPLLPAEVQPAAVRVPGIPVPLVRLVPRSSASVVRVGDVPLVARGRYGRGLVELWAFDALAPEARAWPGRLAYWRALLSVPPDVPVAQRTLAEELPRTRPLPGTTQAILAVLSVAYILAVRVVQRRWGGSRGGWAFLVALAAAAAVVLYTLAAGARAAAASIAQVSIVEMLPGLERARVTTYVSVITPYGGRVTLRLPRDALARPVDAPALRMAEPAHTVTGGAPEGQLALEVSQMIGLPLQARAEAEQGGLVLVMDGALAGRIRDPLLYRGRQIYRLNGRSVSGRVRLDPARWEPALRAPTAGSDLMARTLGWLLPRLESAVGGDLWLLGVIADDRLPVRTPDGGPGDATHLLILPLRVR